MVVGSKLETYLFENSRVCVGSYSNFHVFYYLRYGAPESLKERLSLEHSFSVSWWTCLRYDILALIIHRIWTLQNLPVKPEILDCKSNFATIDHVFSRLRFSGDEKNTIYRLLAAILHLSSTEIGGKDFPDDEAYIIESTAHHIEIAARLLNVSANDLKRILLHSSVKFSNTTITWV